MASPAPDKEAKGADEDEVPLSEIVFSCCICQATPSEVYQTRESNQGFHSGSGDEDGTVTKMWIGNCSHVICAKHLEGGAAPFHPEDKQPSATCPYCHKRGDDSPKDLYAIRGLRKGELDPAIPERWVQCPAIALDGEEPGMEALRFQYMALADHAGKARERWCTAARSQKDAERALAKERDSRREAETQINELKTRVETLEEKEKQLEKWQQRKPYIQHYLDILPQMARDNQDMKNMILELGYEPPECKYEPKPELSNSRLNEGEPSAAARKRKYDDYQRPSTNAALAPAQRSPERRESSRDMMPPPMSKPVRQISPPKLEPHQNRDVPRSFPASDQRQLLQDQFGRAAVPGTPSQRHPNREFHPAQIDSQSSGSRSPSRPYLPARSPRPRPQLRQQNFQDARLQDVAYATRLDTAPSHGVNHERLYGHNPTPSGEGMRPVQRSPFTRHSNDRTDAYPQDQAHQAHSVQRAYATPPRQAEQELPIRSVQSPFFDRMGVQSPSMRQPDLHDDRSSYRPQPKSRAGQYIRPSGLQTSSGIVRSTGPYTQSHYPDEHGFASTPHRSNGMLIDDPRMARGETPIYSAQPSASIPQTPRQRDVPPQHANMQFTYPQPPSQSPGGRSHSGRVSLPRDTGPTNSTVYRDNALRQIPGMRSGSATPAPNRATPSFNHYAHRDPPFHRRNGFRQ